MNIKVKYNHPASPRNGINPNKIYNVVKEGKSYYLVNGNEKIELEIEKIKILFEPLDGSKWDDILKQKPVIENTDKFKKNRKFKEVGE